jgi:hypothetical protein
MRRAIFCLLLVAGLLLCAAPVAFAQGCAMCRSSAAALGQDGQRSLNLAIMVLLVPATSIFGGVLFWAFRKRDCYREDVEAEAGEELEPAALRRSYRN